MQHPWTYHNPVKITAEAGSLSSLPSLVPTQGNVLLITTPGATRRGLVTKVANLLGLDRVHIHDQVTPNPELDALDNWTSGYISDSFVSIIALGGGSVMDAAKVLGVTIPSGLNAPLDQLFRQKKDITWSRRIPVIAIPTTSGTGAEVTPFATVWDQSTHKKHSVAGGLVYPVHALLDPELTLTLPHSETLYTGLDAISHALESLWNKNKTPVSEALALQALQLTSESFTTALAKPDDLLARADMQNAAMLAGLAISQTRTAIAHSISYPLTSRFNMPHGLACSFTLMAIIENNAGYLEKDVVQKVHGILGELDLPQEVQKYASKDDIIALVSQMTTPDRAGNYVGEMGLDEVEGILDFSTLNTVT